MRILAVDDDPSTRHLLQRVLEPEYEVLCANDGCEALQTLREHDCSLVITDWRMPNMDGLEFCKAVRKDDSLGYVYIIFLTGYNAKGFLLQGLAAGADDFICKPFDPEEMRVRVRAGERLLASQMQGLMIFALAKLAESRDPETGQHLERVRNYARIVARELHRRRHPQVNSRFVQLIYETSPLHDVGKVAIPDSILLKPGPLTESEFEIMKTHAMAGARTLDAVRAEYPGAGFLHMAREIAATHHEKFDGSGYPNGQAGEAIPLCGRIMALVDAYDAITSRRVYKRAFSHAEARDIIVEESGSHFDPMLVDVFLSAEDEFLRIRNSHVGCGSAEPVPSLIV